MIADSDGINAHLDDRVIIAAGLCHISEIENVFFGDLKLF